MRKSATPPKMEGIKEKSRDKMFCEHRGSFVNKKRCCFTSRCTMMTILKDAWVKKRQTDSKLESWVTGGKLFQLLAQHPSGVSQYLFILQLHSLRH